MVVEVTEETALCGQTPLSMTHCKDKGFIGWRRNVEDVFILIRNCDHPYLQNYAIHRNVGNIRKHLRNPYTSQTLSTAAIPPTYCLKSRIFQNPL